jgi:hypothetical protein
MAVVVTMELAVPSQVVLELAKRMNVHDQPPHGLIVHAACEVDGKVRITDVWESEADFRNFEQNQLGPTVHQIAEEMGAGEPPAFDGPHIFETFEVVHPHIH